jgi:hypothetical protein
LLSLFFFFFFLPSAPLRLCGQNPFVFLPEERLPLAGDSLGLVLVLELRGDLGNALGRGDIIGQAVEFLQRPRLEVRLDEFSAGGLES